ncbi:glutamine synthetase III [Ileibacterium valens]|uniref:Glutamine synthetase type III n=1 Tax=Ileibacterium valens TaxID=1862668 RepID=A0A1U7NGV1_9FIRM|nr:glutamine synthetase III [Ileibacterium valens]OLU38182.1 glutamine synthetase type III [Erysipelotrichaceae bacterium NYU-BL-E8]OLU40645.1 glutamine synthetase type III [Ileibacterium valens]OLU43311.1 glutamine synthetase type III [Erysipelotrichaceae bacterium NYU-BL-F16]
MEKQVTEIFGENVFDDSTMRQTLPKDVYKELRKTIDDGLPLNRKIADAVAHAMKVWALEKGVTHFTHWFQPMTGVTAEKHDSFITPAGNGKVLMEFSGKELIKGEPDASSFPSGGLRATFEARGYTAWDPTSNAFIKEGVLCIPTAFASYTGHALDKKTPLLRSMDAINTQALRILRLFGDNQTRSVKTTVGPEQEYFLVDEKYFWDRKDLVYTGRTLFGSMAPKGQEMEDHYFGTIKSRVQKFMTELDEELWKLGVTSKTEHNEVAPAQHEMAPIFTTTNLATDQNQLAMELIQRIAKKHGMVALLHEKPFDGINGSGKHNNWSISTDSGDNLLEPGDTPYENIQFLLFLAAIVKAVDEHQDLLRLSVATAGNDHRLGANEAPPAIISIFMGDELEEVIEAIRDDKDYGNHEKIFMNIGTDVLPNLPIDTTDRNRTSPFAFTGNKFEFRMPGSAQSIAGINVILNSVIADSLREIADALEAAPDFDSALHVLIQSIFQDHSRIIFNGNGYSDEWVKEAQNRGLLNLKTTPDALPYFKNEENIALFERLGVFSREEVLSRYEILMEEYVNLINIEAKTMVNMAKKEILPAVAGFEGKLADIILSKKEAMPDLPAVYETRTLEDASELTKKAYYTLEKLETDVAVLNSMSDFEEKAFFVRDHILADMEALREPCDFLEDITDAKEWPFPTYGKLLFGIQ